MWQARFGDRSDRRLGKEIMAESQLQMFGGDWTERKLDVLSKYLRAYTTALKKTPFNKLYIDAFAGTGYREVETQVPEGDLYFPELAATEPVQFRDGSARIALKSSPAFDRYIFIEKSSRRDELEKLRLQFPDKSISIVGGDANTRLTEVCSQIDWKGNRAVLFLDPFGMQVEWKTIEVIAKTRAIDLWYLFPSGIGVNRLLAPSPEAIPPGWAARLDKVLGSSEWLSIFYKDTTTHGVFDTVESKERIGGTKAIADYFRERLAALFPGVAKNPGQLKNSNGTVLYHLYFAAANERGAPIALDIAEHLLKGL